jgi:RNA polymerase sigma factor (sigma-70 family)
MTTTEPTDEQLMLKYAAGDMAAFELLYERHRSPLYRFILRQVGDPATANDLYQGCWEKIVKARKSYKKAAPFRAWMFRIARNHVVDHFRRAPPAANADPADLSDLSPGPEAVHSMQQNESGLAEAITSLPLEQREVVMLKLESGFDLNTIANLTGVNMETAKSRLRYAVAKLKLSLGETQLASTSHHG